MGVSDNFPHLSNTKMSSMQEVIHDFDNVADTSLRITPANFIFVMEEVI